MDYNSVVATVKESVTPTNVALLVLLLVSEIMGTSEKFQNSSIFSVVKSAIVMAWEKFRTPPTQA